MWEMLGKMKNAKEIGSKQGPSNLESYIMLWKVSDGDMNISTLQIEIDMVHLARNKYAANQDA